ncbi:DUF3499 domain-containing protein [Arthrobacter sp. FX8]|uniref:DUF3499 domain-containing protein n=1 Tax=Arthrobacter sp. FX8 TaxID=2997335 RepID=UPI003FA35F5A
MYADSTAVLGPLATYAEPHCYDLCEQHADSLTVPRGWEVLRLAMPSTPQQPGPDDLLALANAVRDAAALPRKPSQAPSAATIPPLKLLRAPKGYAGGTCGSSGNLPDLHLAVRWKLHIFPLPARARPPGSMNKCLRSVPSCCPSCVAP